MLAWSSPWWLAALVLIPVIWLLHRLNGNRSTILVSTLSIWKLGSATANTLQFHARTDPLWLLRALIVALLVLALSGPHWLNNNGKVINIWFDDSLSMLSLEEGKSRLDLAVLKLANKLQNLGKVRIKIYALSEPTTPPLTLETAAAKSEIARIKHWLTSSSTTAKSVLPYGLISTEEHWLVTDGAELTLNNWLKSAPVNQLIRIGEASENTAITMLSLRPSLKDPKLWQGIIQLQHFGHNPDSRTLQLFSGTTLVQHWQLSLAPDQVFFQEFALREDQIKERTLIAELTEPDALHQDDKLELSGFNPISTRIEGQCPVALLAAIKSHPFLNTGLSATTEPELTIACGNNSLKPAVGAVIRFHSGKVVQKAAPPAIWLPAAGSLQNIPLNLQSINYFRNEQPKSRPILIAGQQALITVEQTLPIVLDCFLDMSALEFTRQPEYPVFFAGLVDLALNKELLAQVNTVDRNPQQSRIEPLPIVEPTTPAQNNDNLNPVDIVPYLIIAALLLLVLEIWLSRKT